MSKRFLTPPTIPSGTSNPTVGNDVGDLFFRSDENRLYVFTSTGWAITSSVATNLAGGTAGRIPYQTAANTTAFVAVGTAGQVLISNGTSAPTWSAPPAGGFSPFLLGGM